MKHFLECPDPNCLSMDVFIVKKEAIPHGTHFTDHKITYQCNICGKRWTVG